MKFGSREICDVTFKTTSDNQRVGKTVFAKAGMPAFMIDTAKTSSMEQATTTVYAQGGKGYNRLIAWEGEKTMTFTVEDALISPQGLAVLSGAGLLEADNDHVVHVHVTRDVFVGNDGTVAIGLDDLKEETGLESATEFEVCKSTAAYATVLDGSGAGIKFISEVSMSGTNADNNSDAYKVDRANPVTFNLGSTNKNITVKLDFYLIMSQGVTEIEIKPQDFGGFFYIEAQTLYRREDTGADMAAELIFPKVKVQSGFTLSMAASGDPSTFTFTMDAFPGYTKFDKTKKVMCVMQVIGTDATAGESEQAHQHTVTDATPSFHNPGTINVSSTAVGADHIPTGKEFETEYQANQGKATVAVANNVITVTVDEGVENLSSYTLDDLELSTEGDKPWIALDINTGSDDITQFKLNGVQLTQTDVANATAYGLENGHILVWVDASDPEAITLNRAGYTTVTLTVTVEDAE